MEEEEFVGKEQGPQGDLKEWRTLLFGSPHSDRSIDREGEVVHGKNRNKLNRIVGDRNMARRNRTNRNTWEVWCGVDLRGRGPGS